MSDARIRVEIGIGEDWSGYIEWTDKDGNYVINDPYASAWMEARDKGGSVVIRFENGGDTTSVAAATVIGGEKGIIRLTAPRNITEALPVGTYDCDLVIEFTDPDQTLFASGQRSEVLKGDLVTYQMTTQP